jgi:hypothetical protein
MPDYCTEMPAIDPNALATLIWLPKGQSASPSDFDSQQSWSVAEAVKQAYGASKDHDKSPWIMTEGRILDENQIVQVMSGLRAMGLFDRA